jgi:hypothetical protein
MPVLISGNDMPLLWKMGPAGDIYKKNQEFICNSGYKI